MAKEQRVMEVECGKLKTGFRESPKDHSPEKEGASELA